jgi:hypothetical protein
LSEEKTHFVVEPFDKRKHDRAAFSCEHEALVSYLQQQASQDIRKHVAAVFILTPDGRKIAGYYSLSQYGLDLGDIPDELLKRLGSPKYPQLPATLIGRLARNLEFRGQGVGELLLMSALEKAFVHSKTIASFAVVVDAKDDLAKEFLHAVWIYCVARTPDSPFPANENS